jgi:hypothetical protein
MTLSQYFDEVLMISALMFIAALIGLVQFGVSYWRSLLASTAAQPLSERFRTASGLEHGLPGASDFSAILSLHRMTPSLENQPGSLRGLQVYYSLVDSLRNLSALRQWANAEMATCSRYLAVIIDQRLSNNQAFAAEMRAS